MAIFGRIMSLTIISEAAPLPLSQTTCDVKASFTMDELAITTEPEAIICLMDNSESSRNGDFWPDRLSSQMTVVRKMAKELKERSVKNRLGFGVIANEIGIIRSLTSPETVRTDIRKLEKLGKIQSAGQPQLGRAIRAALLSLRHGNEDVRTSRVIAMIAADSIDMKTEEQRKVLIDAINKEKKEKERQKKRLLIDFLVFGRDIEIGPFEAIRDKCRGIVRIFEFRRTGDNLEYAVMGSDLMACDDGTRVYDDDMDPELRQALEAALLNEDDIAMQQALQASIESMKNERQDGA